MWLFWLAVYKLRWILGAIIIVVFGLVIGGVMSILPASMGTVVVIIAIASWAERNFGKDK